MRKKQKKKKKKKGKRTGGREIEKRERELYCKLTNEEKNKTATAKNSPHRK